MRVIVSDIGFAEPVAANDNHDQAVQPGSLESWERLDVLTARLLRRFVEPDGDGVQNPSLDLVATFFPEADAHDSALPVSTTKNSRTE